MSRRQCSFLSALFVVIVWLLPASARAAEPAAADWQFDLKASYVVMGAHAARATGGVMPSLAGFRTWPLSETVDLGLGVDVGLFGLGGASRWLGVLGGPTAALQSRPFSAPFTFELAVRLDFGRIPVCDEWGLCIRYLGFFPAFEAGVAYRWTQRVAAAATCGLRSIQTFGWSGVTVEPAVVARVFWP